MKDNFIIGVILLLTFVAAFFATTALTDAACRITGYYVEGINDDNASL